MARKNRSIKSYQNNVKAEIPKEDFRENTKDIKNIAKSNNKQPENNSSSNILLGFLLVTFLVFALLISGFFSNPSFSNQHQSSYEAADKEIDGSMIEMTVVSSPTCGCCHIYVEYLQELEIQVNSIVTQDWMDIKEEKLIPSNFRSCHTSIVGEYFVEGHVPANIIHKLLNESPEIDGISLPNMPAGTPGMPGQQTEDYVFYMIKDGVEIGIFTIIQKP
jgi:hypothetical protein